MINNTEHVLVPEDILEIDILPNLANSAGYQNIDNQNITIGYQNIDITMIDLFSRIYSPTQHRTQEQKQLDDAMPTSRLDMRTCQH